MKKEKKEGEKEMTDFGRNKINLGHAICVGKTEKAIKVIGTDLPDPSEEYWIPNAMIDDDSEVFTDKNHGNEGNLIVLKKFAEEKGWC